MGSGLLGPRTSRHQGSAPSPLMTPFSQDSVPIPRLLELGEVREGWGLATVSRVQAHQGWGWSRVRWQSAGISRGKRLQEREPGVKGSRWGSHGVRRGLQRSGQGPMGAEGLLGRGPGARKHQCHCQHCIRHARRLTPVPRS